MFETINHQGDDAYESDWLFAPHISTRPSQARKHNASSRMVSKGDPFSARASPVLPGPQISSRRPTVETNQEDVTTLPQGNLLQASASASMPNLDTLSNVASHPFELNSTNKQPYQTHCPFQLFAGRSAITSPHLDCLRMWNMASCLFNQCLMMSLAMMNMKSNPRCAIQSHLRQTRPIQIPYGQIKL